MANHKQAIKRHRQSLVRNERNNYYKATMRTYLKRARTALDDGDKESASTAIAAATKWLDHIAVRGAIPKKRAARLVSRLHTRLNGLG